MKYIPKYQKAGKLPILPAYNYQMVQDNATMQRPIETDMMSKEEQIKRGHDLRVKEKQEALTKYRNQPGMISGMKQNPTQSDMKEYATQAVAYNNKLRNDPVGTLGPDVAMSILPELLLLKGPSQAIGKGLNYLNPFKFKLPKILKSTSTSKPLPVGDFTNLEDAERFLNRWSRIHINDDYMNNALISKYGPESSIENLNTLISANQMTELDAYNTAINAIRKQSNNFNGWKTAEEVNKMAVNVSGFPKIALPKDNKFQNIKHFLMSDKTFKNTVLTPKGTLKTVAKPQTVLRELGNNVEPAKLNSYVDKFNNNLITLNDIINRNNTSGVPYRVVSMTPDGRINFTSSLGESNFAVGITPGKFTGEVKDLANFNYYENIPGIRMTNTSRSVFGDDIPRRGTKAYESINEYLKLLDMGRVKSGFNSQTLYSRGLWKNLVNKNKAIGYFGNESTIYGIMKGTTPLIGLKYLNDLEKQKNSQPQ